MEQMNKFRDEFLSFVPFIESIEAEEKEETLEQWHQELREAYEESIKIPYGFGNI